MTKRIVTWALVGSAFAGLVMSPVLAASDARVSFCGKVAGLTEGSCVGVTVGGTTYELSAASPKPAVGTVISGGGVVSDNATTCMQGKHLTQITWQAVSACPVGDHRPSGY